MTIKKIRQGIIDFWNYLTWRDMGSMGEGCLASLFIWGVIIVIGGLILKGV